MEKPLALRQWIIIFLASYLIFKPIEEPSGFTPNLLLRDRKSNSPTGEPADFFSTNKYQLTKLDIKAVRN